MKNRSVQAMSIGLSAITLAGSLGITAFAAQSSDALVEVDDAAVTPTDVQEATISSSEVGVAEDVSQFSEQLNTTSTSENVKGSVDSSVFEGEYDRIIDDITEDESKALEAVDSTSAALDNVAKAAQARDAAGQDAKDTTDTANTLAEDVKQRAQKAVDVTEAAVNTLKDDNTTQEEAEVIVGEAGKSVEEAETAFAEASEKYDQIAGSYYTAKSDYQTALAAYNSNKENAISTMSEADEAFAAAQAKLADLEAKLAIAREELAAAGADAIIAAEDQKDTDAGTYVKAVIEYFYIPSREGLEEQESVSAVRVSTVEDDEAHLQVSYDILDAQGQVLRTIKRDCGYQVDSESGQISLYTMDLAYQYTNAQGETVSITKEEADALDGQVEISNYWVVDGYYIPTYVDRRKYEGARFSLFYTADSAVQAGKDYVESSYEENEDYYNTSVSFDDDWISELRYRGFAYVTSGTFTATYNKVAEKEGYAVSDSIKNSQYDSREAAISAVTEQAQEQQGASSIDESASKLSTTNHAEYAAIVEKYINTGDVLFKDTMSSYTRYMTNLRARVTAYDNLLKSVESARNEYKAAQERVASIKQQIEQLDGESEVVTLVKFTQLEMQLRTARSDYYKAKDNLETAKTSLSTAKDILESKKVEPIVNPDPSDGHNKEPEDEKKDEKKDESKSVPAPSVSTLPSTVPSVISEAILDNLIQEIEDELRADEAAERAAEKRSERKSVITYSEESVQEETEETPAESSKGKKSSPIIKKHTGKKQVTIPDEAPPTGITVAGLLARGKWFAGLGGAFIAAILIAIAEIKRHAETKIIDKMNQ